MACQNPYTPPCCQPTSQCYGPPCCHAPATSATISYASAGPTGPTGPANPSASGSFTVAHISPPSQVPISTTGTTVPYNAYIVGSSIDFMIGNGMYRAPSKGLYLINATIGINASADTTITTSFMKNSVTQLSHVLPVAATNSTVATQQLSTVIQLGAGETLQIQCQSSVSNVATLATAIFPAYLTSLSITPLSSSS